MTADNARQMHKMNCRNEAEIDFGITKCRAFPGKEHVAGNGQRHAATPRRAADGGDRRLAEIVLYVGQLHVELVQQSSHIGCRPAEHQTQVQPRAESTRQRARQHDGANVLVGCGPPQRRYELLEQRKAQRIHRRSREADLRDLAGNVVAQVFIRHHSRPPRAGARQ